MTELQGRSDGLAVAEAGFHRMWTDIAPIGYDHSTGGYQRFAYSDPELALREWFCGEAATRGLEVHEDRAGNLWAWWGTPGRGDAVVTGSHLDSVPAGGAYDGPLGVVSGFIAVDILRHRGVRPSRPVAVVAFADEEGSRFGLACTGSRLLTGSVEPDTVLSLRDDDGISMAEALRRSGRNPMRFGPDPELLATVGQFIELHVEQGRGLVDFESPVGVASSIRAHGRWRLDLTGCADHAGTTRLEDRDDPMLRQASAVLAARQAAMQHGGLATIGRIRVEPNGVNAIPSRVSSWLDARADSEDAVRAIVRKVADVAGVTPVEESWTPRVELDSDLIKRLVAVLGGAPVLATGAGHDAGILALAGVPTGMLFVRNPTGVSHSPQEHARTGDCLAGTIALADVVEHLTDEDGGSA